MVRNDQIFENFYKQNGAPHLKSTKMATEKCNFKCSYFSELRDLGSIEYGQKWQNISNIL